MSSKNVVNPDHYKVGGSGRQGEAIASRPARRARRAGGDRPLQRGSNFIPGAAPVGKAPGREEGSVGRQSSAEKSGLHSTARKKTTASRGGKAPGKARRVAGASGTARRKPTSSPSLPRS